MLLTHCLLTHRKFFKYCIVMKHMKLVTRSVTDVVAGGLDYATRYYSTIKGMITPFRNLTDWYRVALVVSGLLLDYFDMGPSEVRNALFDVGTALLTESVINAVSVYMGHNVSMLQGGQVIYVPTQVPGQPAGAVAAMGKH